MKKDIIKLIAKHLEKELNYQFLENKKEDIKIMEKSVKSDLSKMLKLKDYFLWADKLNKYDFNTDFYDLIIAHANAINYEIPNETDLKLLNDLVVDKIYILDSIKEMQLKVESLNQDIKEQKKFLLEKKNLLKNLINNLEI